MIGGPLQLIFGPAGYIFLATLALNQFKIAYVFLARIVMQSGSNPVWQTVQPAFKQYLSTLEAAFGSPSTFTPTATHVLLVAVMLVMLANRIQW